MLLPYLLLCGMLLLRDSTTLQRIWVCSWIECAVVFQQAWSTQKKNRTLELSSFTPVSTLEWFCTLWNKLTHSVYNFLTVIDSTFAFSHILVAQNVYWSISLIEMYEKKTKEISITVWISYWLLNLCMVLNTVKR